jgi:hypothetical protein
VFEYQIIEIEDESIEFKSSSPPRNLDLVIPLETSLKSKNNVISPNKEKKRPSKILHNVKFPLHGIKPNNLDENTSRSGMSKPPLHRDSSILNSCIGGASTSGVMNDGVIESQAHQQQRTQKSFRITRSGKKVSS